MIRAMGRATSTVVLVTAGVAGCAGLNVGQEQGWVAFRDCQKGAPSATLEDLSPSGRVHYQSLEGVDFSSMKACMERGNYACDLGGPMIGSRPHTLCYPKVS
jgi:hypothetical protein